jgi:hypothetical protein
VKAPAKKPKKKRVIHESAAARSKAARKAAVTRAKNKAKAKRAAAAKGAAVKKAVAAVKTAVKAKPKPAVAAVAAGLDWVACNEILPCCSAVAAANSLLAVTGWRVSDDDVYALHFAAGGTADEGASLAEVMETLLGCGLAGIRPARITPVEDFPDGAVAAVLVPGWEWHAVAVTDGLAASWGGLLDGEVLDYAHEVWALTW